MKLALIQAQATQNFEISLSIVFADDSVHGHGSGRLTALLRFHLIDESVSILRRHDLVEAVQPRCET